jgi:hypothetical protein
MTRRRIPRSRSNQPGQLAHHFPSLSGSYEILPQSHMFMEDVRTGLIPYARMSSHGQFSASIGDDPAVAELLYSITNCDHAYSHEQLVCDSINKIVEKLSWFGRAIYQTEQDETDPRIIRLRSCTSQRLYKLPGFYIHHVPPPDQELFGSRFIVAPATTVWDLGMPEQLGGTKEYLRVLRGLKRYKGTFPQLFQEDLRSGHLTSHFHSSDYIRWREAHKAHLTSLWGWPRRNTALDHETEFFHFYRTITFRWAQAILRDHIITKINMLLQRLQIDSQITIQGLLSPASILEVRQQMTAGTISFGDAFEKTSIFSLDE